MSIVFDDMIPVTLSNKKLNPIAKPFSYFITQPYFAEPKNIRLNSMHYFVMKIPNKQELQQIAFNYSSDFANFYKVSLLVFTNNVLENHILF